MKNVESKAERWYIIIDHTCGLLQSLIPSSIHFFVVHLFNSQMPNGDDLSHHVYHIPYTHGMALFHYNECMKLKLTSRRG